MLSIAGEIATAFVRVRAKVDKAEAEGTISAAFKGLGDRIRGVREPAREVQVEIAKVSLAAKEAAAAGVQAAIQTDAALRQEIASYREVALAAQAGSREQVAATNLAIDAEQRLARAIGVTTAEEKQQAAAAASAAGAARRGASRGTGAAGGAGVAASLGGFAGGAKLGLGIVGVTSAIQVLRTALVGIVKGTADFETELNTFQAVASASGDQMDAVGRKAKQLGADVTLPKVSAADAAEAMTELAKGGVTVRDAMEGARGTLQLATAGMLDNATAAGIVAQQLNVFGLAGDKAGHVADLLAGASAAAQGEVSDMAIALQQSAAVARGAGFGIEDTVSAIALLAKNGLLGSDAGTSLRTTLLRLVPTSKEAAQQVAALGVAVNDTQGRLLPLGQIFQNYHDSLKRLTPVQRQQALTTIFGTDAIRAATIFAREGVKGFDEMLTAVDRQGIAADLAAARTKGLAGSFGGLKSNLETVAISIGQTINPAIKQMVDGLNQGVTWVQTHWGEIKTAIQPVLDDVSATITSFVDIVTTLWDRFGGTLTEIWQTELGFVIRTARRIFAQLRAIFETIAAVLHGDWDKAWKGLKTVAVNAINQAKDAILSSGKVLRSVGSALGGLLIDGFQAAIGGLEKVALQAVEKVLELLAKVPTRFSVGFGRHIGVKNPAQGALESIRGVIAGIEGRQDAKEFADSMAKNTKSALDAKNRDITAAVELPIVKHGGKGAHAAGARVAQVFTGAVANTITADNSVPAAIDSLQQRLAEAVRQGAEQMKSAVIDAQRNLVTLGQGLSQQLSSLIDAGPVGQQLKHLQDVIAKQQTQRQGTAARKAIVEASKTGAKEIAAAEKDLADARAAIGNVGSLDASQKAEVAKFLKPKTDALAKARKDAAENLRQAKQAERDFTQQVTVKGLQDRADAEKKNATQRVDALTGELIQGTITGAEFNDRLTTLLGRDAFKYEKVGKILGAAFMTGFGAQLTAVTTQANEILAARSKAPALLGQGVLPNVVRPLKVLDDQLRTQQQIRDEIVKTRQRAEARADAAAAKAKARALAKTGGGGIVTLPDASAAAPAS